MTDSTPRPALAWMDMLERIEESLAQSLRLTPDPGPGRGSAAAQGKADPLAKLDERLARWQACLDEAEASAAATDRQLGADQEALLAWREQSGQSRERLAGWAGRAVG